MLIDPLILIDHLRGRSQATQFLSATRAAVGLRTSAVVAAELLAGARDRREQTVMDRLLTRFHVEPFGPSDGDDALNLLRQHRLAHGIGWTDCLIAAAAIRLAVPVATLNDRHFRIVPGLAVHRPY